MTKIKVNLQRVADPDNDAEDGLTCRPNVRELWRDTWRVWVRGRHFVEHDTLRFAEHAEDQFNLEEHWFNEVWLYVSI